MIKWTRTLVDGKTPIELIRLQLDAQAVPGDILRISR